MIRIVFRPQRQMTINGFTPAQMINDPIRRRQPLTLRHRIVQNPNLRLNLAHTNHPLSILFRKEVYQRNSILQREHNITLKYQCQL